MSLVTNPVTLERVFFYISLTINYFTKTFFLSCNEIPSVLSAILPGPFALTSHFSVNEITFVEASIFHKQLTLAVFPTVLPPTLVLKERVLVCIRASANSELRFGVNIAVIASFEVLHFVIFFLLVPLIQLSRFVHNLVLLVHFKL